MESEHIDARRAIVHEHPDGIEIIIPARKSYSANLFLGLWMMAWVYGESIIMTRVFGHAVTSPDAFMVVWLAGWTLAGLFALVMWLRNNKGQELVSINENRIRHARDYVLFSRSSIYASPEVCNLRVNHLLPSMYTMSEGMEFWGLSGGSIVFNYGMLEPKFGLGLGDAEAEEIVDVIKARYKILRQL